MANHTIEYNKLDEFEVRHEITSSCGSGSNKSLVVITARKNNAEMVYYEVIDHGKCIYSGGSIHTAINAYNCAFPRNYETSI